MPVPILYSFRRCPYAMRARLAIASSGLTLEHREILLRDKAPEFLAASPKGTVPVVVDGVEIIEESLDVMQWALSKNDPERLLDMPREGRALIETADSDFKDALDRTKYASRMGTDPEQERLKAQVFLVTLSETLGSSANLFGERMCLADLAALPFVRQFAHIDRARFDEDAPSNVKDWLNRFLNSDRFNSIMKKYPMWKIGDAPTMFLE